MINLPREEPRNRIAANKIRLCCNECGRLASAVATSFRMPDGQGKRLKCMMLNDRKEHMYW